MNKRIIAFILTLIIFMNIPFISFGASEIVVKPKDSSIIVDKVEVKVVAFNINGNNYFKLRDLAMILKDTGKKFGIGWDDKEKKIDLKPGENYTSVGGELILRKTNNDKKAIPTNDTLYLDGEKVTFTTYKIDGNNYFKLRDIGQLIDFYVGWDEDTRIISIDTSLTYKGEIINKTEEDFYKEFVGKWTKEDNSKKEEYEFFPDGKYSLKSEWGEFTGLIRPSTIKEGFFIMVGDESVNLDEEDIEEPLYIKIVHKGDSDKYGKYFTKNDKIILGSSEYGEIILIPVEN